MKKITFLIFCLFAFNVNAIEKKTTFTEEIFKQAQSDGTVVVINSWNKYCGTCAKQVKILNKAKEEFKNILFLSYEQKNKDIAEFLNIKYWTTIVIYKNNKEIYRSMGETKEEEIFSAIKSTI
jgi:thiol-disulfide isomerase/thioredoxin